MLPVSHFTSCSCLSRFCTSAVHQRYFSDTKKQRKDYVRYVSPSAINWYPGHMQKGLKEIGSRLTQVDVVIELHDARIPLTGRCQFVKDACQIRPHILVMNKADLAEPMPNTERQKELILCNASSGVFNQAPAEIIFSNMKSPERQKRLLRELLSCIVKLAPSSHDSGTSSCGEFAYLHDDPSPMPEAHSITAMVVGLPNCGKSSLINALRCFSAASSSRRQRKQTAAVGVGRDAGRTRAVGGDVIIADHYPVASTDGSGAREFCTVRLVDTPGILEPKAQTLCGQLSLAVCGAVDWNAVDKILLADYLLFCLNNRSHYDYVSVFGMSSPTANVNQLLAWVAARRRLFLPQPVITGRHRHLLEDGDDVAVDCKSSPSPNLPLPDFNAAAQHFLRAFNDGRLGRLTLLPHVDEEAARSRFILAA